MTKKSSLVPLIVRELQVVGLQHSAPDEWPSEGGSNWKTKVEADGNPPVTNRARMMVREASGRESVNLGGIAGVKLLSLKWGRSFFVPLFGRRLQTRLFGSGCGHRHPEVYIILKEKTNMKKLLSVLLGAAMVLSLAACGTADDTTTDNNTATDDATTTTYKVGIVNYVDDPSLAQIQAAVEAELDAKGQELGVTFSYADYTFNAQGDQSNLNAIAADLMNDEVDLIIPIATPTALVIQNATAESGTPVVFSAVSDPVGAGLVASMDAPGSNITGTSDALDTHNIFKLIETINPELDKVGLLYDASQDSSTQAIEDAESYLAEQGIAYTAKTGTTTDDLALAADALIADGCTVIFTPTDNTVQVAEPALYQKFIDAGVQHFGGADSFALVGAFCGYGVDYENLGTMTADLAVDILVNGKDPASTPVQTFDNGKASINTDTCQTLGLDYETIKAAIEPLCTSVEALTTAAAFTD